MKFLGQLNENPLKETHIYKELPPPEEENTERTKVIMMVLGGHVEVGDPLTKEDTLIEDLLVEDILIKIEDLLEEEDTLVEDP